jgi:ribose transport system ATP-binding protein
MRRLRDEGVAIVLVTHHIEDVMAVGDRVSVMRNGALVDSFALDGTLDGGAVLERLTGRKRAAATPHAAPASSDAIVDFESVPHRGGQAAVVRVRKGEIVGFYGVVGCGAEALVRGLVGEASPRQITYRLHGRVHRPSSAAAALRDGVSYLPAGRARHGVLPGRSILENASIGQLRRFSRGGAIDTVRERREVTTLLADFQVKLATVDDPIVSLSGGNQQKVLLARTIGAGRDVVVLEEPTAGVDVDAKAEIHRLIRRSAGEGATVVLLSSDLAEAIALCNTLHTMYAGAVVATYRDPSPADQPSILFDVLGRHGASVDAATTGTPPPPQRPSAPQDSHV